jgi:hypothetical protein
MPFLCRAEEQYKSVETSELLKAPQKYWARPIVFKDTLIEPPEDARVDIEGKRYAAFSTRDVGACYASADLLPAMSALEVNREYLFSGTVFQNRGRYVPVIHAYTPAMDVKKLSVDLKTVAEETPDSFTNQSVRPMADLLAAVQSAQVAYAKEKNIPLCQLYDPTSEHFVKAMDIARTAIYKSEQKNNTASAEILAQYLSTVLAKQCAPGSATQAVTAPESSPENQESPADVEEAPIPATTNITPAKLSWSERRALARAKKAAKLKEQQERAAVQAAQETITAPVENRIPESAEEVTPPQDAGPGNTEEPDASHAAEDAARKAAADYETQQKDAGMAPEMAAEPAASKETETPTNIATAAESSGPKPPAVSWFQRWKLERQKRALIDAELRRIEQEKEEAAQRLAAEKKAEERRQADMKRAEEQRRSDAKKAEDLKKKQEAERMKAEARKAKAAAAKTPSEEEEAPAPSATPANRSGIFSPVGR